MQTADGQMIQRCLDGETEAFGVLVDKYRSSMYALAYSKVQNFQDAEDITQEAFLIAYQKLDTLRRWDNFFAWMYSITSNLCKKELKKRGVRPDREPLEDQNMAAADALSLKTHHEQMVRDMVHDALDELPAIYRQVLSLYYLGGMNTREIAEFLGTPVKTVESRLSRARAQLKEEMITMMSATFEGHRLQPGFTFRVIEAIKRTKIQSIPHKTALPFGASIVAGLIALLLSLTVPHSPLYRIGQLIGSVFPSEMQVTDDGVIPVDAIKVTQIMSLSDQMDDGDFGQKPEPEPTNFFGGGKWERKADMQIPRQETSPNAAVVDGKIWIFGGSDGPPAWNTRAPVEVYDPATNTWVRKTNMPTPRAGLSTSAVDGIIYTIGGYRFGAPMNTVEAYDPVANRWETKAPMPTARHHLSTSVVDGIIYAIGGAIGVGNPQSAVEAYNPATNTWEKKKEMPTPRGVLSTSVVDGKIYAIGGTPLPGIDVPSLSTVEVYDPATDTWEKKKEMPLLRKAHAASVVNGKIYVIGGGTGVATNTVQVYDPATDTWERKADMPTARTGLSAGAVDGRIYVIGGRNPGGILASVEEFDPEIPSSVSPRDKLPVTWGEVKAAQ